MEPIKFKALLSAVIIASGALMMLALGTGVAATPYQSQGLAIDFGDRDVIWTDFDLHGVNDPVDLLISVCEENGFDYEITTNRTVAKIRDAESDNERWWDFWVINKGEKTWTKLYPPYDTKLLDHTSCAWAYCSESEKPTVGADQSGNSIFGYARPERVISLSPSITEMVGSLNAVSTLVGTDRYSNYPNSVVQAQLRGDITIVGDWVSPSYETIMGTNPDMVFCDGSQYSHHIMSERLRKADVRAVVLYPGESIEVIIDNIYIIGVTLEYEQRAQSVISMLEYVQDYLLAKLMSEGTDFISTMFALSPDKSPWVAGRYTYIDDISAAVFGENSMPNSFYGWVHVSSEIIAFVRPSVIIIVTEEYGATPYEYGEMLSMLSAEWKSTPAYNDADPQNSQIYMLCGDLAEMAMRPGPRYAQLMELIAMILHPEAFGQELPRFIGSDYESHLTITKDYGFNS